jgi:hypothetical protein
MSDKPFLAASGAVTIATIQLFVNLRTAVMQIEIQLWHNLKHSSFSTIEELFKNRRPDLDGSGLNN